MPSVAYTTFKKNVKQVDKLLLAFKEMRPPTRGRKHLDHFTRAALIFLCSSWEVYVEQIALESGKIISGRINNPNNLPLVVKKTLSDIVKKSTHELEPINISKDWKTYYYEQIYKYISKLNTPKNDKVTELLNKYLGISGDVIKAKVTLLPQINKIVQTRGEIAHNIYAEEYLKKELVDEYYDIIKRVVKQMELLLWDYIPQITNDKRPWQNTY